MDRLLDTLFAPLDWLATSPYGPWVGMALLAIPATHAFARWWSRRRAVQAFAAGHGLRYVGTVASDGRPPYVHVPDIRLSVTLPNAVEGTWEGLPVAIFDYRASKHVTYTAAIVTAPDVLGIGTRTVESDGSARFRHVVSIGDVVCVVARSRLEPDTYPRFLSDAVALTRDRMRATAL